MLVEKQDSRAVKPSFIIYCIAIATEVSAHDLGLVEVRAIQLHKKNCLLPWIVYNLILKWHTMPAQEQMGIN